MSQEPRNPFVVMPKLSTENNLETEMDGPSENKNEIKKSPIKNGKKNGISGFIQEEIDILGSDFSNYEF